MRSTREIRLGWVRFAAWVVMGCCLTCAVHSTAQSVPPGSRAVYGATQLKASTSFIDASVLPGGDICAQINYALIHTSRADTVIDARGLNTSNSNANLVCSSGTPWGGGSNATATNPSTILLPAGTIQISNSWILPNSTRVVGAGSGLTTIQALTAGANPMIQMGAASPVCPGNICTGVSIEDLTLDGNGLSGVSGIVNDYSQTSSYAKHVTLYQIVGTGLMVSTQAQGTAQDSGPYSDITFNTGNKPTSPAGTVCAQILGGQTSNLTTRGIHGLTCISNGTPSAALLLDASGNSVEDVQIQGFADGILVGQNAGAQSNVLSNISGGAGVTNVLHIENVTGHVVTDLAALAVASGGAASSIRDDLTRTTLSDAAVGIYALGEPVSSGSFIIGYSRFTSSPNAPSWSIGSKSIPANTSCGSRGALYSNTAGTAGGKDTWYVCTGNGTTNIWTNIE